MTSAPIVLRSGNKSPKPRSFFRFGPDVRGDKTHGVFISNEDALITPGMIVFAPPPTARRGFAKLPETPHLIYDRREGRMPRDLEGMAAYWLVSEKLKNVFETVDPDGFAFVACDFTLPDGSKGPQFYLCDVIREVDALDEFNSRIRIIYDGDVKIYGFMGELSIKFKEEMLNGNHVFLTPYSNAIFCDNTIRDACKYIDANGILFERVYSP